MFTWTGKLPEVARSRLVLYCIRGEISSGISVSTASSATRRGCKSKKRWAGMKQGCGTTKVVLT